MACPFPAHIPTSQHIPSSSSVCVCACVSGCVMLFVRLTANSHSMVNNTQNMLHAAHTPYCMRAPWNIAEITLLLCCCRGAQASLSAATRAPSPMHTNIAHSHAQHTHTHTQKMCARQCVSGIVCSVRKVACSPAAVRLLSVDAAKQPNITAVMCTNRFFLCAQRCSS